MTVTLLWYKADLGLHIQKHLLKEATLQQQEEDDWFQAMQSEADAEASNQSQVQSFCCCAEASLANDNHTLIINQAKSVLAVLVFTIFSRGGDGMYNADNLSLRQTFWEAACNRHQLLQADFAGPAQHGPSQSARRPRSTAPKQPQQLGATQLGRRRLQQKVDGFAEMVDWVAAAEQQDLGQINTQKVTPYQLSMPPSFYRQAAKSINGGSPCYYLAASLLTVC